MRGEKGIILGEIVISVVVVASLVYIAYMISESIGIIGKRAELKARALYAAKLKMEEIGALNFEDLNTAVGCEPVSNIVGIADYMPSSAQVCVNVDALNWDSSPDIDGKEIKVTVKW